MGRPWSGNQALGQDANKTPVLAAVITLSATPTLLKDLIASGVKTPSTPGPGTGECWLHPMLTKIMFRPHSGASGNYCFGATDSALLDTTFPELPPSAEAWAMTYGAALAMYLRGAGGYDVLLFA